MTEPVKEPVAKAPEQYRCYRIKAEDTNRLAIIFDPIEEGVSFIAAVEIYDEGGKTPPNWHNHAYEMFYIIKVEGRAYCQDRVFDIRAGDSFLAPPPSVHVIENTGEGRLYALCVMVPNEAFAELIRDGVPEELDEEDLAVLRQAPLIGAR